MNGSSKGKGLREGVRGGHTGHLRKASGSEGVRIGVWGT